MNTLYIIEHLKIAKCLAKADEKVFLTYLIEMAIDSARSSSAEEPQAKKAR
jgi:hypothetical protein